jgi:phosphoribosylanthranilate isomerase
VALVVDADDATLDAMVEAVPLDMLQLHGHETPDRVAEVKARYGLPVMKAMGVADEGDLAALWIIRWWPTRSWSMPSRRRTAALPGGNGLAFDWRLVAQRRWLRPWMLAGGLTPDNVAQAIRLTNARQVDVSSGVESAPGVKDAARIAAFAMAEDGLNSFMTGPDEAGPLRHVRRALRVSETLMPLILELEARYEHAKTDPSFWAEMDDLWKHYVGRPRRCISRRG